MATTITRASMTDGVTVWDVARIGSAIYDEIDAVLGANIIFGGTIAAEGFGTHTISSGGTGQNSFRVRNTTSGTTNLSALDVGNNSTGTLGRFMGLSSAYTTSGYLVASAAVLEANGAGGLSLATTDAAGDIRLYTNSTLRLTVNEAGAFAFDAGASVTALPLADGAVGTPSLTFASDSDTGLWWSAPSTVPKMSASVSGFEILRVEAANALHKPVVRVVGNGTGGNIACPRLHVERNSGGSTAPGCVALEAKNGTVYYLWVDTTGDLRVGTTEPDTATGDTGGAVVGTQS